MAKPTDKQGLYQRDGVSALMDEAPVQESPPGVPTWVKVLGGLLALTLVVFVAMHLLTGDTMRH